MGLGPHAIGKATAEAFVIDATRPGFARKFDIRTMDDASSALVIIARKVSESSPFRTNHLWSPEAAATTMVDFQKVHGTSDPADRMITELSGQFVHRCAELMGL